MDRAERRRRDENYVYWMVDRYWSVCPRDKWKWPHRFLTRKRGLKKDGEWKCHHCSKKTPGKPKVPRGACGLGMDRSPKRGRNRWRLDLDLFE